MDLGFEGGFDIPVVCVNAGAHPDWAGNTSRFGWVELPSTRFATVFANDIKPSAKVVWASYFHQRQHSADTFRLASVVDLVKQTAESGREVFPTVDVLTGGFPCQDFSVAGKRKGFSSHKDHLERPYAASEEFTEENRGKLYAWMRDVIRLTAPKVFVAENVKGLTSIAGAQTAIESDFKGIGESGYVVTARVLNAADYGVPQSRQRIFFLGFSRAELTEEAARALDSGAIPPELDPWPTRTHASLDRGTIPVGLSPWVTARQALAGLPEPEHSSDPSHLAYSKAKWMGKHCQGQSEVSLDALGPTIRSEHHGNIEFRRLSKEHGGRMGDELARGLRERRLTVRECARLQTFPDDFEFVRLAVGDKRSLNVSASDAYKLIGNATPPLLIYHIAKRLEDVWPRLFGEFDHD